MEAQELHRGGLLTTFSWWSAIWTPVADSMRRSKVLGIPIGGTADTYFGLMSYSSPAQTRAAQGTLTGRHHLAFQARDRAMVEAFHQIGLAMEKDNGSPGEDRTTQGTMRLPPRSGRQNIEAVYHGEAARSAASVKIEF